MSEENRLASPSGPSLYDHGGGRTGQYVLAVLWLSVLLGFKYWYASRGIDLIDEGMWLSTSLRYALGDLPFRDEIQNAPRPFDVLVSVVFRIHPTATLLQMRCLGLFIEFIGLGSLFLFVSRYAAPLYVAALCTTVSLLHDAHGLMSPSYNLLSEVFGICALILWLSACVSRDSVTRTTNALLSGILLLLCVATYLPLIALLLVPVVAIVQALQKARGTARSFLNPTLLMIAVFVLGGVGLVIAMHTTGIWDDFQSGLRLVANTKKKLMDDGSPNGQQPAAPWDMLWTLPQATAAFLISKLSSATLGTTLYQKILAGIAGGSLLFLIWKTCRDRRFLPLLLIALLVSTLTPIPLKFRLLFLSATVGVLGFLPVTDDTRSPGVSASWRLIRRYMLYWGFCMAAVYLFTSGSTTATRSVVVLLVVGLAALMRVVSSQELTLLRLKERRACIVILWATVVPLFLFGLDYDGQKALYTTVDDQAGNLTASFVSPRLAGIRSTPEKVAILDELLASLEKILQPGDYLLAYPKLPLLHFLTSTRPATNVTWIDLRYSEGLQNLIVEYMLRFDRIPEVCVKITSDSRGDWASHAIPIESSHLPIDRFVRENFYLDRTIAPFEIWRRNSP